MSNGEGIVIDVGFNVDTNDFEKSMANAVREARDKLDKLKIGEKTSGRGRNKKTEDIYSNPEQAQQLKDTIALIEELNKRRADLMTSAHQKYGDTFGLSEQEQYTVFLEKQEAKMEEAQERARTLRNEFNKLASSIRGQQKNVDTITAARQDKSKAEADYKKSISAYDEAKRKYEQAKADYAKERNLNSKSTATLDAKKALDVANAAKLQAKVDMDNAKFRASSTALHLRNLSPSDGKEEKQNLEDTRKAIKAIYAEMMEANKAAQAFQESMANASKSDFMAMPKSLDDVPNFLERVDKELDALIEKERNLKSMLADVDLMPKDQRKGFSEMVQKDLDEVQTRIGKLEGAMDKWATWGNVMDDITKETNGAVASIHNMEVAIESEGEEAENSSGKNGEYARSNGKAGSSAEEASRSVYLLLRAFNMLKRGVNNLRNMIINLERRAVSLGKKFLSLFKITRKTSGSTEAFSDKLKHLALNIMRYGLGIRSWYSFFNKFRRMVESGLEKIVQASKEVNLSISNITSAWGYFKNAIATTVIPIITALEGTLVSLCNTLAQAANSIASFLAALTGQDKVLIATAYWQDYADSITKAGNASKQLAGFDELNNLTSGSGSGSGEVDPSDMFDTVEIEAKWKELADKIRAMLAKLIEPFKQAWNNAKNYVYKAFTNLWTSIKDLGITVLTDVLDVWDSETTVETLENILLIVSDITNAASNLVTNFKNAWSEGERGKTILTTIRDIMNKISTAADTIALKISEWSKSVDFAPLLEAVNSLLSSIDDNLSPILGMVDDLWTKFVQPMLTWLIETGLPKLISIASDFIDGVDWEKLRSTLAPVLEALEKFVETVGAGLLQFLSEASTAISEFINDGRLAELLTTITDKLGDITASDVADFLWDMYSIFEAVVGIFKDIAELILKIVNLYIEWHDKDPENNTLGSLVTKLWELYKVLTVLGQIVLPIITGFLSFLNLILRFVTLIPRLTSLFTTIGNAISGFWGTIKTGLATVGGALAGWILKIWTFFSNLSVVLEPAITAISDFFAAANPALLPALVDQLLQLLYEIPGFGDWLWNLLNSGVTVEESWNNFVAVFKEIWSDWSWLSTVFDGFNDMWDRFLGEDNAFKKAGYFLLGLCSGLATGVTAVLEVIRKVAFTIIDFFCTLFGINSPSKVFEEFGEFIIEGLVNGLENMVGKVKDVFNTLKKNLTTVVTNIKTTICDTFVDMKNAIVMVFEGLWNKLKSPINTILGGVESMANGVINGINNAINAINNLEFTLPDWVPLVGGETLGFTIPTMSNVSIPRLAKGGVIPANNEFLAVLGDQKHGTNIETPLDTMIEAFNMALAKNDDNAQIMSLMQTQITLLQIIAEKEFGVSGEQLFQSVRDSAKIYQKSSGRNAFTF